LDALVPLLKRTDVEAQGVRLTLHADSLTKGDPGAALIQLQSRLAAGDRLDCPKRNGHTFQLIIPVRPVFRGGRTWMVKQDGRLGVRQPEASLVKALAQAHQGLARHSAAPTQSPAQWAGATGITESYLRRLTGAGFLAPDIQQAKCTHFILTCFKQPASPRRRGLRPRRRIGRPPRLAWSGKGRSRRDDPLGDGRAGRWPRA